jgi:hypothetical protein
VGPSASDFERPIKALAEATRQSGVEFMLVGGQAVLLHGVPRLTQHIDLTLSLTPDEVGRVLDLCVAVGLDPLPADPRRFAREPFVLPAVDGTTGVRVDFILSTIPYEREALRRSVGVRLAEVDVPFAAVEDLILSKLLAGRPRDIEDVSGHDPPQECRDRLVLGGTMSVRVRCRRGLRTPPLRFGRCVKADRACSERLRDTTRIPA